MNASTTFQQDTPGALRSVRRDRARTRARRNRLTRKSVNTVKSMDAYLRSVERAALRMDKFTAQLTLFA